MCRKSRHSKASSPPQEAIQPSVSSKVLVHHKSDGVFEDRRVIVSDAMQDKLAKNEGL